MRGGAKAIALLLAMTAIPGVTNLAALQPRQLTEIIAYAAAEVPDTAIVEIGIEEGWEHPIIDVEFADGRALYLELAPEGLVTLGRERDNPDRDRQRIAQRLFNQEEGFLSLSDAYASVLRALESGFRGVEVRPEDLYELEYEIEYGRLVLEVVFQTGRRDGEITVYADPGDGSILSVERDD